MGSRPSHLLHLAFRPGGDSDLQWAQDPHDPWRSPVEIVSDAELKLFDVDRRVDFGHTNQVGEGADSFRANASAAHRSDRWHPWIFPAVDVALVHERQELALAQDGVINIETRELVLAGSAETVTF